MQLLIGYARVSTTGPDLAALKAGLNSLGVDRRIHVDHGLTGTNRARPGLREPWRLAARGDTLVVTRA